MLIREGSDRTIGIDSRLAALFSATAGALNAAGFQAFGFFSANMTGNASSFSDYLSLGNFGLALTFASLIVSFICGAFLAGLLIEVGRARTVVGIYAYAILFEGVVLALLAIALLATNYEGFALIFCLSFVLGLQNAATTRISDARVRTTHVSGMATDIGLGLAAKLLGQANPRFKLSILTMPAFLIGGIAGGWAYAHISSLLFLLLAAVLSSVAVIEIARAVKLASRRPATPSGP